MANTLFGGISTAAAEQFGHEMVLRDNSALHSMNVAADIAKMKAQYDTLMMQQEAKMAGQMQAGPARHRFEIMAATNGGYVIFFGNDVYIATSEQLPEVIISSITAMKMRG